MPKRPVSENYIPLHGANYFEDNDGPTFAKSKHEFTFFAFCTFCQNFKVSIFLCLFTAANNATNIINGLNDNKIKPIEFDYPTAIHSQSTNEDSSDIDQDIIRPDVHLTHMPGLHLGDIYEIPPNPIYIKHPGQGFVAPKIPVDSTTPSTTTSSTTTTTTPTTKISQISLQKAASKTTKQPTQSNPTIPLKLITILHNTKKESPTKVEPPQRKNNKIIDPTDEPLVEENFSSTSAMPVTASSEQETDESLTALREAFLSSLSLNTDISDQVLQTSQIFSHRPHQNQLSPSYIAGSHFPANNNIESKHGGYQTNPIRSELYLIVPELNKNKGSDDLSHTNNYSSEKNYQVLPNDEAYLTNTESDVVNPVDVDKLKGGELYSIEMQKPQYAFLFIFACFSH